MTRASPLPIGLDPGSDVPLFLQIARSIMDGIRGGRLQPGEALPGSRTLAKLLDVHRNTVIAAYAELAREGWVAPEMGGGTFVSRSLPTRALPPKGPSGGIAPRPGYALARATEFHAPPTYPRGTLILAKGAPDTRLLPITELARSYRRVLALRGRELLMYGDPRGHRRLRASIAKMLATARGLVASTDCIMVTRGSQMALDLAARALVRPGDVVAVEALGSPAIWAAFRLAGARVVPVPLDESGMSVEALAAVVRGERVRAVYLTPHHQFPTTTVMPPARRAAVLELARERAIAVIEDDYDHEFHYDGRPVLPMACGDRSGTVVYVGTLSKILAPGLRIGFVVAPAPMIERMASLRVAADLQGDQVVECAVAELFETGELGRHARRMRRAYEARRDALAEALRCYLGGAVGFIVPSGGMALWAGTAPGIDVDAWAARALARGVAFNGARMYDFAGEAQPFARLGFTFHTEDELAEAARRMAAAL